MRSGARRDEAWPLRAARLKTTVLLSCSGRRIRCLIHYAELGSFVASSTTFATSLVQQQRLQTRHRFLELSLGS
jgi:hypothetical protein